MVLYNLMFGNGTDDVSALFFRGDAALDPCGTLKIPEGSEISFETYFNLFSHTKFRKYCGIREVFIQLKGKGTFCANFYHRSTSGIVTLLYSSCFCDTGCARLSLSQLPQEGYIYLTVQALTECELFRGYFFTEDEKRRDCKIGIVICTYRREEFVYKNLQMIEKAIAAEPEWASKIHVFIIDNGSTVSLPESSIYTVVPNKNLGGSGGFTRGIIEVEKAGTYSHFLLMDDDIRFEFETLKRTYYLLSALNDEYENATVGGAMLYLDRPTVQHEFGGYFSGLQYCARNSKLDLAEAENLLLNEQPVTANYNAWWFTCMPVQTVAQNGLPLPLFIKGDDVEYGIRCIQKLILMNGIGVWHQDFTVKYSAAMEYYGKRNELIDAAIHFKIKRRNLCLKLMYTVFIQLALKRYDCAELILRAYSDFFAGYRFLIDTDLEALNREIMRTPPQFISKDELEHRFGLNIDSSLKDMDSRRQKPSLMRRALLTLENFLPSFLFSKKPILADANSTWARPLFLKKISIHYDIYKQEGYVCELDTKRRRKIRRAAYKMFFKILFGYGKTETEYKNNYKKTCSLQVWKDKLDL